MGWFFSLIAMFASFDLPGGARHEQALAMLYTLAESQEIMKEVAGKDDVERVPYSIKHDGDAPIVPDRGKPDWPHPAQQYTVVVERPAVLEADGVHCNPRLNERVREAWYTICIPPMPDASPYCTVISIEAVCCITEREEVAQADRCPKEG